MFFFLSPAAQVSAADAAIPISYFGLHIHHAAAGTPWPPFRFGSWRLWDAYVSWPHLEPEKGKWTFQLLDAYAALAEKNNIELVLPLGLSPAWASARPAEPSAYKRPGFAAGPRDMQDWRNYVRTVAARYKGRIRIYEIWNEPNLKGFYTGTVDQMIALAREAYSIIKEVDPLNTVISPSAAGNGKAILWLEEYLSKGGDAYADVIGYHFYVQPGPPEDMKPLIEKIGRVLKRHHIDKPLWNTETGWLIPSEETTIDPSRVHFPKDTPVLPMTEATASVSRALIINWAAGVRRFYWYAWDSEAMGLVEPLSKKVKKAGSAYNKTAEWMTGARMAGCRIDPEKTWICGLEKGVNRKAWLIWNEQEEKMLAVHDPMAVREYETLIDGGAKKVKTLEKIPIGRMPILLKSDELPWNASDAGKDRQ